MYLLAEGGLRKDRQSKEVDPFCSMFVFENKSKKLVRSRLFWYSWDMEELFATRICRRQ